MNSIFEPHAKDEIISRIQQLRPDSTSHWGKMSVAQMLAHCSAFQDIALGTSTSPRSLIGRLVGRFVKPIFYNEKPLPKNVSTIPTIMIEDEREFEIEKEILIGKIVLFHNNGPDKCTKLPHAFFGKFSPEQWSKGIYKHLDHHLKQFGV